MSTFLNEVSKKFAERWVSLLALPGLLLLATAACAASLRHSSALDWRAASDAVTKYADSFDKRPVPAVLTAVAVLLAAAAAGLIAQGLGVLVLKAWTATKPRRLARWRLNRWERASVEARNHIALCPPDRPTWIGDRLRGAGVRVLNQYGFDLPFGWTRLWLLFPESTREELRRARDGFVAASTLTAWGALYLAVGAFWWPASIGGLVIVLVGWRRGRDTAMTLADLVEAAADLHVADLAKALSAESEPTLDAGRAISERMRKGA